MRAGLISAIIDRSTQSVQCFMCKLRKTSSSFVEKELAAILGSRRCRCDRSYQCSPLTDLTDLELAQHTSPQVQWALGRQRGPSLYQHGRGECVPCSVSQVQLWQEESREVIFYLELPLSFRLSKAPLRTSTCHTSLTRVRVWVGVGATHERRRLTLYLTVCGSGNNGLWRV